MSNVADAADRRRDVAAAGHRGDVALARAGLLDPAAAVRATALRAVLRAGALTPGDVAAAAADADAAVRRRAAEVVAAWPDGRALHVVGLLADADPSVVEVAAWAVGECDDGATAADALARLAGGHDDALCREAAVAALGALGARLDIVLAALSDKAAVRRRAVVALAAFDGPEVDAALEAARSDRDWQVRQIADDLLEPG